MYCFQQLIEYNMLCLEMHDARRRMRRDRKHLWCRSGAAQPPMSACGTRRCAMRASFDAW
jgi:hypothetical protein